VLALSGLAIDRLSDHSSDQLRAAVFFFFNDTAPTQIYTLSLHDALPIWREAGSKLADCHSDAARCLGERRFFECGWRDPFRAARSEEHTSELQSLTNLVCRLLLEKKKGDAATRRHKSLFESDDRTRRRRA